MESKIYYSIVEVSSLTDLPASTLRYWEERIPELSPRKDDHGNRYYCEDDILLIKRIKYLRDEMRVTSSEAIRRELRANTHHSDVRQQAAEILSRARKELVEIRNLI